MANRELLYVLTKVAIQRKIALSMWGPAGFAGNILKPALGGLWNAGKSVAGKLWGATKAVGVPAATGVAGGAAGYNLADPSKGSTLAPVGGGHTPTPTAPGAPAAPTQAPPAAPVVAPGGRGGMAQQGNDYFGLQKELENEWDDGKWNKYLGLMKERDAKGLDLNKPDPREQRDAIGGAMDRGAQIFAGLQPMALGNAAGAAAGIGGGSMPFTIKAPQASPGAPPTRQPAQSSDSGVGEALKAWNTSKEREAFVGGRAGGQSFDQFRAGFGGSGGAPAAPATKQPAYDPNKARAANQMREYGQVLDDVPRPEQGFTQGDYHRMRQQAARQRGA